MKPTLYDDAREAKLPWRSMDAQEPRHERAVANQQDIDFCLMCGLSSSACDKCDGKGNVANPRGRRPVEVDKERLREMMRLRWKNDDMCNALNIKKDVLFRAKREIKEEQL